MPCLIEQIEDLMKQKRIIHCLQLKNPSSHKIGTRSGVVNVSQGKTTEM